MINLLKLKSTLSFGSVFFWQEKKMNRTRKRSSNNLFGSSCRLLHCVRKDMV